MKKRIYQVLLMAIVAGVLAPVALQAETRLFVPRFDFGTNRDTQFLLANAGDQDANVDLWAFTAQGELLGQFQVGVKAHGTRAITLGEGLALTGGSLEGWLGVVSPVDGIQLTYSRIGDRVESFEATEWIARETRLPVGAGRSEVLRLSNPNAVAGSALVRTFDATGAFMGVRELSVNAFAQVEIPVATLAGGVTHVEVTSNVDVLTSLESLTPRSKAETRQALGAGQQDLIGVVVDSAKAIGAYQVTLSFDPTLVQFNAADFFGGNAQGFESKPLVINVDNVAGLVTIGSFQVGASPEGQMTVARIRVTRQAGSAPRFGIRVDEISDVEGNSLGSSSVAVGLVRLQ